MSLEFEFDSAIAKAAQVQEVAAAVLGAVNSLIDRDAVIAGGYARDSICGIPSKDVDIWFCPDAHYYVGENELVSTFCPIFNYNTLAKALRELGYTVSNAQFLTWYNEDESIDWMEDITKIKVNGIPVDLVCLKKPIGRDVQALFDQFDFGICMAALRGKQVIYDERFLEDLKNKTITFYDTSRDKEDMDRVLNDHLPRLKEKFPRFKVKGLEDYGIN